MFCGGLPLLLLLFAFDISYGNGPKEIVVQNWMSSFPHVKVILESQKNNENQKGVKGEYSLLLDSTMNVGNLPGNFLIDADSCPATGLIGTLKKVAHKIPGVKKLVLSCQQHNMKTFFIREKIHGTAQKTYPMLVSDKMTLDKFVIDAKLWLLDGNSFDSFDSMLETGALYAPQIDGVFSMAFTRKVSERSGMESILEEHGGDKLASLHFEPFEALDFNSKTIATLTVGGLDSKRCEHDWNWLKVPEEATRWQFVMEEASYTIDGKTQKLDDQTALVSISDTFIFAPESFVKPIFDKINVVEDHRIFKVGRAAGKTGLAPKDVLIYCPSDAEYDGLPTVTFKIGNKVYFLGPREYIVELVIPAIPAVGKLLNWCHLMIRPVPTDNGMPLVTKMVPEGGWLFTQLFFNKLCVAFDYSQHKVGFATSKTPPATSKTTGAATGGAKPAAASKVGLAGVPELAATEHQQQQKIHRANKGTVQMEQLQ